MTTSNLVALAGILVAAALNECGVRGDEAAKPNPKAEPGVLVVVDNAGKEHKLKTWQFIVGTRRLPWLAPAPPRAPLEEDQGKGQKPKKPAAPRVPTGPEALVFRDENSTDLKDGVFNFILLDRIKAIDYDNDKRSVQMTVAVPGEKGNNEEILTGSTRYVGENKLTIEAEADLGELGLATVKFQGGVAKGIKSIRFPPPRVKGVPVTRLAEVTIADKNKDVHKVTDLQPLYRLADGSERLIPTLLFKKTVKIDLAKIQKLSLSENGGLEFDVTLKDGKALTLTLLDKTSPVDGKAAQLLGFVASGLAGYKYYPLKATPNNTFTTILFDPDKVEGKKEEPKKEAKED
jgi:hypothetical protein